MTSIKNSTKPCQFNQFISSFQHFMEIYPQTKAKLVNGMKINKSTSSQVKNSLFFQGDTTKVDRRPSDPSEDLSGASELSKKFISTQYARFN